MPRFSEKSTYSPCGRLEVMWIKSGLSLLSSPHQPSLPLGTRHKRKNMAVPVTAGTFFFSFFFFLSFLCFSPLPCQAKKWTNVPPSLRRKRLRSTRPPPISRSRPRTLPLPRWPPAVSLLPLDWRALRAVLTQLTEFSASWKMPRWASGANKNEAQEDASDSSLKKLLEGKIIMTTRSKE